MMRRQRPLLAVLLWTFISFLTLFPIYWLFVISVKPAMDLFATPELILRTVHWQNYIDVLKVDVEGAEWDVFRDLLLDEDAVLPFGQLLIELHLPLKRGGSAVHQIPVPFPRLLELLGRAAGVWSSCLWVLNAVCLHSARNAR